MDVLTWAAAQAIATIALNKFVEKFVESDAGELGKQLTAALSEKVMTLGTVVWDRIRGNVQAVAVLEEAAADSVISFSKPSSKVKPPPSPSIPPPRPACGRSSMGSRVGLVITISCHLKSTPCILKAPAAAQPPSENLPRHQCPQSPRTQGRIALESLAGQR
ncbi:hypothetical protein OOK60_15060 [Trichothermofontia sichuanensis B231]|uniref:hypothetical protein n=1 Tax=Trichothermofontia sichuanensis TaxID=3045816 RepID=UPI0022465335|nr:hypothetical protein [Trichothermofontia sichuanensis]UZQ53798.1 hypothetical protein OOK60_15060 [Trichothermofontia sichuanensis B231]